MIVSAINFGRIDAKREFLEREDLLVETFIEPPRLRLNDFRDDQKCFIVGLKGTGKTALLRYLELRERREWGSLTEFVLFASDFSEEDRRKLSTVAGFEVADDDRGRSLIQQDFEVVWTLFLAQLLSRKLRETTEYKRGSASISKFVDLFSSLMFSTSLRSAKLVPTLKDSKIKIGIDEKGFAAKFETDVEFNPLNKTVSVDSVIRFIDRILSSMGQMEKRVSIFIDELELPYGDPESFTRDAKLIRDMIVTIRRFNDRFRIAGTNIRFFAAIRSEVIRSVASLGKEVNKDIEDLAFHIGWNMAIEEDKHPLLQIIEKKIESGERRSGIVENDGVWQRMFPAKVNNLAVKKYVLHSTWYRPRDIVRLMRAAQSVAGNRDRFLAGDFEQAVKTFSTQAWIEHTEELQAAYSEDQVRAIKNLLQTFARHFSLQEFELVYAEKSRIYPEIQRLRNAKSSTDLLQDLFRIGVIGNNYRLAQDRERGKAYWQRWVFRGDSDIELTKQMTVHRALWKELSIA